LFGLCGAKNEVTDVSIPRTSKLKAMSTLYIILFTALFAMTASAQVVFDIATAFPSEGTLERQWWYAQPFSGVVPTTGTNVTWDLSTGLTNFGMNEVLEFAAPSATPHTADFPDATHAFHTSLGDSWYYFDLEGDSLFSLGFKDAGVHVACPDPKLEAVFPFSYGMLIEDSSACGLIGEPYPAYEGWELVATGTMITPIGTIPNVAMLSYYNSGEPVGAYEWFQTSNILVSIGQYDATTLTIWPPTSGIGVQENGSVVSLHAYPNPARTDVVLEVPWQGSQVGYALMDATGRALDHGMLIAIGGRVRLDVTDLSSGNYALRLAVDGTTAFARVSVVR
jgi:hypothetical protein